MGGMKIHIFKKNHHSNSIINGQIFFCVFLGFFGVYLGLGGDLGCWVIFTICKYGGMKIHIDKKNHHSNSIINGQNLPFSVFWGDFD